MSGLALPWLLAAAGPLVCAAPVGPSLPAAEARHEGTGPSLRELYEAGVEFQEFLARADRRERLWRANYEAGEPSPGAVGRAARISGRWHLLVIAEDGCSDSAQTIPYLARLAERASGIELRIVDSRAGRELMKERRTPDGRAATPTVLVLDAAYEEAGCWIERPSALQDWALENRPRLSDREFLERKMAWYDEDRGRSTLDEVLAVIEAAASGRRICGETG